MNLTLWTATRARSGTSSSSPPSDQVLDPRGEPNTVYGYQGSERDIIIISSVKSGPRTSSTPPSSSSTRTLLDNYSFSPNIHRQKNKLVFHLFQECIHCIMSNRKLSNKSYSNIILDMNIHMNILLQEEALLVFWRAGRGSMSP